MRAVSVELENELLLDAARDRVWALMNDVPQVIPCIPGGRLLEAVDDSTWKAEVGLDLGFTRMVFHADVVRRDVDATAGRAVLVIHAVDSKEKSRAEATMTSTIAPAGAQTQVSVVTDINMEGEVARFGPGIIEDVAYEIVEQMTQCLQARLAQPLDQAPRAAPTENRLSLWRALVLWLRGRRRRRARTAS
jgi:carbon monoxide dehydrogenase subunit G